MTSIEVLLVGGFDLGSPVAPANSLEEAQAFATAAAKLADAAAVLTRYPVAIQLRYLQTMREIASERNTTSFFPITLNLVELIMKAIRTDRAT